MCSMIGAHFTKIPSSSLDIKGWSWDRGGGEGYFATFLCVGYFKKHFTQFLPSYYSWDGHKDLGGGEG